MPVRFGSQAPTLADQVFSALSSPLAQLLKLAFPDGLQHWSQSLLLIATLAANSWLWGMALAWLLSLARPRS